MGEIVPKTEVFRTYRLGLSGSFGEINSAIPSSFMDSTLMVTTVTPESIKIKDMGSRSCAGSNGHKLQWAQMEALAHWMRQRQSANIPHSILGNILFSIG
jgi:hypothetical protein